MPPIYRFILELRGCANRPVYHIMAAKMRRRKDDPESFEQIGSFDPMPNEFNESLVAINYERLQYWFGQGATPSRGVGVLLGLAGYTMVHPYTYRSAWRLRDKLAAAASAEQQTGEDITQNEAK